MRRVAFAVEGVEGNDEAQVVVCNNDGDNRDPRSKQVEQEIEADLKICDDKKYYDGNFQPLKLDLIKPFAENREEDSANEEDEELPVAECIEQKQKQKKNIASHRGDHEKTESEHMVEDLKSVQSEEYIYKSPSKMTSPDKMRFA